MKETSKAQRDSEELRRQNEAESRECMRETVVSLQAELARYKKALSEVSELLARSPLCHIPLSERGIRCDSFRDCADCVSQWALSKEASYQRSTEGIGN